MSEYKCQRCGEVYLAGDSWKNGLCRKCTITINKARMTRKEEVKKI